MCGRTKTVIYSATPFWPAYTSPSVVPKFAMNESLDVKLVPLVEDVRLILVSSLSIPVTVNYRVASPMIVLYIRTKFEGVISIPDNACARL